MIHLVIGGSGSGKSEYAENLLEDSPGKYYIATMQVYDAEGRKKVARHQRLRAGKGFQTIEQTRDIHKVAEIIVRDRKQTENKKILTSKHIKSFCNSNVRSLSIAKSDSSKHIK